MIHIPLKKWNALVFKFCVEVKSISDVGLELSTYNIQFFSRHDFWHMLIADRFYKNSVIPRKAIWPRSKGCTCSICTMRQCTTRRCTITATRTKRAFCHIFKMHTHTHISGRLWANYLRILDVIESVVHAYGNPESACSNIIFVKPKFVLDLSFRFLIERQE